MYVQYSNDNMFHVEHFTDLQECSTREPFTVWVVEPDGVQNRQSKIGNLQFLSVLPVFSVY